MFQQFATLGFLFGFALAGWCLHLAEDLLKVADFCKIHVTGRAAPFAVGAKVFRPEVVSDKLVGFGLQGFQCKQVAEGLSPGLGFAWAEDHLPVIPGQGVDHAVIQQSDVIVHLSLDKDFLQGGNRRILARENKFHFRRFVGMYPYQELNGFPVFAFPVIDQFERITTRPARGDGGVDPSWFFGISRQHNLVPLSWNQASASHGLVQREMQGYLGSLEHIDIKRVLDAFLRLSGVRGWTYGRICALEFRIPEDAGAEGFTGLAIKEDAIDHGLIYFRNDSAKDRILQVLLHREGLQVVGIRSGHQYRVRRDLSTEAGTDHQAVSGFHLDITRADLDRIFGHRGFPGGRCPCGRGVHGSFNQSLGQ